MEIATNEADVDLGDNAIEIPNVIVSKTSDELYSSDEAESYEEGEPGSGSVCNSSISSSSNPTDTTAAINPNPVDTGVPPDMFRVGDSSNNGDTKNGYSHSFFVDSPYYDAFVTEEVHSLEIITKTLSDIHEKTKTFAVAGSAMADATQQLSLSCLLRSPTTPNEDGREIMAGTAEDENDIICQQLEAERLQEQEMEIQRDRKRKALGDDIANVLERVGKLLSEIGTVQEHMCGIVENALCTRLVDLTSSQSSIIHSLKEDVETQSEKAETMLFKYLNGKEAGGNLAVKTYYDFRAATLQRKFEEQNNKNNSRIDEKKTGITFWTHEDEKDEDGKETGDQCATSNTSHMKGNDNNNGPGQIPSIIGDDIKDESLMGNRSVTSVSKSGDTDGNDKQNNFKNITSEWKQLLHNIRREQATAEFKRFQLFKYIINARQDRGYEYNESSEEFCSQLLNYYTICTEKLKKTTKEVQESRIQAEKMRINHQSYVKKMWSEKEKDVQEIFIQMNEQSIENMSPLGKRSSGGTLSTITGSCDDDKSILSEYSEFDNYSTRSDQLGASNLSSSLGISRSRNSKSVGKSVRTAKSKGNRAPTPLSLQLQLEKTEKKIGFWDFPTRVAMALPYYRVSPPGTLMEGWLYEKEENMQQNQQQNHGGGFSLFSQKRNPSHAKEVSPTSSWKRSWCMLKYDGIYCLSKKVIPKQQELSTNFRRSKQKSQQPQKHNYDNYDDNDYDDCNSPGGRTNIVSKICGIDMCTIRELPYNPSERFCFKIMIPAENGKTDSKIFQTLGPTVLRCWINGIRSASCGRDFSLNNQTSFQLMNHYTQKNS